MFVRFFAALGSFGIYILAFLVGIGLTYGLFHITFLAPVSSESIEPVGFVVAEDSNMKAVARGLEQQNLIHSWFSVFALAKLRVMRDELNEEEVMRVEKGEYLLSRSYSPARILDAILNKEIHYHEVTIPPGAVEYEVVRRISQMGLTTASSLDSAITDENLLMQLGISRPTVEGYLFPGTYKFTRPIEPITIVKTIIATGQRERNEQLPEWKERASELKLSPYQLITLASLIEREAPDRPQEWPLISSVFHNRINLGLPVKSEAALRYAIRQPDGELAPEQYQIKSPYNTFLNLELPPTPICSPGIEATKAALNPEESVYLFFFRKPDGTFQYSESIAEHHEDLEKVQQGEETAP